MTLKLAELERGRALLEAGRMGDAAEAFEAAGKSGLAQGYVELASIEINRGNRQGAGPWMQKAEELAERGDAIANLSCSLAYQLGYGQGSYKEDERRALSYLGRSAELGNPVAQNLLANEYLWGLNGREKDEKQYELWMSRAIEQGHEEAIVAHVQNLLKLKREIEPALIGRLQVLAASSESARRLLQSVSPA